MEIKIMLLFFLCFLSTKSKVFEFQSILNERLAKSGIIIHNQKQSECLKPRSTVNKFDVLEKSEDGTRQLDQKNQTDGNNTKSNVSESSKVEPANKNPYEEFFNQTIDLLKYAFILNKFETIENENSTNVGFENKLIDEEQKRNKLNYEYIFGKEFIIKTDKS